MANNSSSMVLPSTTPDACFMKIPDFDPRNMNRPDSVHPTWTFLVAVNGLAAPPTIVVNALVIWVVMRDENLRSSPFNLLLASLAVTDFLTGLLAEPLFCLFLGCLLTHCPFPDCKFTAYFVPSQVCGSITLVSFAIASVERYLAIKQPNFYRQNITVEKVAKTTATAWLTMQGYLFTTTALLSQSHPKLSIKVPPAIVMIILGLVILYCSTKVQLTAYRQRRTIALQQASVENPNEQQEQEQRLHEYKRVFTMTILVALSILFYIPFVIVTAIEFVYGKEVTSDFKYITLPICLTFLHLQSLINPIIMELRLSYIRQGIKNRLAAIGIVQGTN